MTQIRLKDELTNEELRDLLDRAEAECEAKDQRIAELEAIVQRRDAVIVVLERDIHQLELQMEAVGAGGVSSQRITGTDARWYAVSADGMATRCINREDARDTAAEAAQCYPNNAPYTAVQMVPVGDGETFGSKS